MTPQTREQEVKPALINFLKVQKQIHGDNFYGSYTNGKIGLIEPSVDVFVERFGDTEIWVEWLCYGVSKFRGIVKMEELN